MDYRPEEIKVGAFVLLAFLVLVVFIVAISGVEFGKEEKQYIAEFSYTGGIDRGAQVRLGGHLVGKVEEVRMPTAERSTNELILSVDADTPVRTDSEAFITSISLMGDYYVEITTGSPGSPLLPPGSRLRSKDVPPLSQLGGPMLEVSANLNELLVRLNDVLREDNRERISSMLASLEKLMTRNEQQINALIENMNRLTDNIASVGEQADSLVAQNAALVHSMLQRLDVTMKEAEALMQTMQNASATVDGMLASQRENLARILANLERATRNFEDFSRGIKERPWNLVRKSAPKERQLP
jgi:phospholipid/cholesterol/gamma-HCH transport system substrate-binding protein